jgi:hypothetical protein
MALRISVRTAGISKASMECAPVNANDRPPPGRSYAHAAMTSLVGGVTDRSGEVCLVIFPASIGVTPRTLETDAGSASASTV